MSSWMDLLEQLSHLSALPGFLGLLITGSVIAIVRDWRFTLWAMMIQYVLVGLLHLRLLAPELALIRVLSGILVCPMIYWAARWVESERVHKAEIERREIAAKEREVPLPPMPWPIQPTNWVFRLLTILLLSLVLFSLYRTMPLPDIAADLAPSSLWLAMIGLFVLVLTPEPLPAGIGLLTLVSGFGLYYDTMSPGLAGVGLLATVDLVLGLAISHLVTVRALTGEVL